jgi:hypothetical protein
LFRAFELNRGVAVLWPRRGANRTNFRGFFVVETTPWPVNASDNRTPRESNMRFTQPTGIAPRRHHLPHTLDHGCDLFVPLVWLLGLSTDQKPSGSD